MSAVAQLLAPLGDAEILQALDIQLATMLLRRSDVSEELQPAIALATAFTSRALRAGHSAIALSDLVNQLRQVASRLAVPVTETLQHRSEAWWAEALAQSPLVNDENAGAPLVLHGDLLQFRRYHDAERRIADRVVALANTPVADELRAFSIVTGGPGTGKTTYVARQLLQLGQTSPSLRVALAAPTGKAAARMTEAIRQRLQEEAETAAQSGTHNEARTLHRLLGYSPDTDTFRRNEFDPLEHDLVVVDEASMLDVLMLDALLRALKPGARLMLVGDHNQLASVDAGDVLGSLSRAALEAVPDSPLRESVTLLDHSWRFIRQPAIGALATAILSGDADATIAACTNIEWPAIQLREPATSTDALLAPLIENFEACLAAETPLALLDALDAFRILAPEREGRWGVHAINAAVERWLARRGHGVQDSWYHGRPVLVTANDYNTNVFNGDLGVVWREHGHVGAHFRANNGQTRALVPVRLPPVETAWAMTVHKSQGSEFDNVLVVLPERESRMMSRELLYTAVTRARKSVAISGSPAAVRQAVERTMGRTSGLFARMRDASGFHVPV